MLAAILFGLVQGLSEFLPISSSAHLDLAMILLRWRDPPLVMSLVVHVGTLAAVIAVYGRDLVAALRGGGRLLAALPAGRARALLESDAEVRLAACVVVATVPTGIVALLLRPVVEQVSGSPQVIGTLLATFGGVLLAARWLPERSVPIDMWRALAIGLVQGIAVFPGISRSGATIVAGLALGLHRSEAARFSFVASVPAIVGASILEIDPAVLAAPGSGAQYAAAALTAMVTGYVALRALVHIVARGRLWWFALYLMPLGIAVAASLR